MSTSWLAFFGQFIAVSCGGRRRADSSKVREVRASCGRRMRAVTIDPPGIEYLMPLDRAGNALCGILY